MGLFKWMKNQRQQDNYITFGEFKQAWSGCDTDNDEYLSEDEVKAELNQLNLGPTRLAKTLFGSTDIKNKTSLQELFIDIDESSDGYINQTEFLDYYETGDAFDDFVTNGNKTAKENESIIIISKVQDSSVPEKSSNMIKEDLAFQILHKQKTKLNPSINARNN
ncbi:hypothetical protein CHS0354_008129 [Potamilus streckersoni]|uniref:EF-hand domain-containing protein n=1 Tax=Potamilus streckersoni TaxID=2493646 RepID=A0AAE0W4Q5_9BIVA|nr:hypothetical protein CHS0354_008129 [Potamilus streckersoni]